MLVNPNHEYGDTEAIRGVPKRGTRGLKRTAININGEASALSIRHGAAGVAISECHFEGGRNDSTCV